MVLNYFRLKFLLNVVGTNLFFFVAKIIIV